MKDVANSKSTREIDWAALKQDGDSQAEIHRLSGEVYDLITVALGMVPSDPSGNRIRTVLDCALDKNTSIRARTTP